MIIMDNKSDYNTLINNYIIIIQLFNLFLLTILISTLPDFNMYFTVSEDNQDMLLFWGFLVTCIFLVLLSLTSKTSIKPY